MQLKIRDLLNKQGISLWIWIVILSGQLFGIGCIYTYLSTTGIKLPYKDTGLGIVSVSTLLHYPKEQDTLLYLIGLAALILSGIFSLFLWLFIVNLFAKKKFITSQELLLKSLSLPFILLLLGFHNSLVKPDIWSVLCPLILFVIAIFLTVFLVYISITKPDLKIFSLNKLWIVIDYIFIPLLIILIYYSPVKNTPIGNVWSLMAEEGPHLAWVQSILKGGFQGKDFFGLYGPLRELVIIPFMKIFGVNYLSFNYSQLFLILVSNLIIYIAIRQFISDRWIGIIAFIIVMGAASNSMRCALGLLAIALVVSAIKLSRIDIFLLSGVVSGISLFYSQEFGIAAIVGSFICICFTSLHLKNKLCKNIARYIIGILFGIMPVIIYFGLNGALLPMLRDMVLYPYYVSKGQFALIIPPLISHLPTTFSLRYYINMFFSFSNDNHFIWYQPAFMYSSSILYIIVQSIKGKFNKDDVAILALSIFGILSFKAALGRSDTGHLKYVFAPVLILYMIYIGKMIAWLVIDKDKSWGIFFFMQKTFAVMFILAFLLAGNGLFIINFATDFVNKLPTYAINDGLQSSLTTNNQQPTTTTPLPVYRSLGAGRHSHQEPSQIERAYIPVSQNNPVSEVVKFIQTYTHRDAPILAVPENAGFYFLCDRANATRFALFSQVGTDEHRREILRDIINKKPAAIIYDKSSNRVDRIPDSLRLGSALKYIKDNYKIVKVISPYYILFPR